MLTSRHVYMRSPQEYIIVLNNIIQFAQKKTSLRNFGHDFRSSWRYSMVLSSYNTCAYALGCHNNNNIQIAAKKESMIPPPISNSPNALV
jgi:hypothetical protein